MRRRRGDGMHRRGAVTLAAMAVLGGGSWLLVSVATASVVPRAARTIAKEPEAPGRSTHAPSSGSATSGTVRADHGVPGQTPGFVATGTSAPSSTATTTTTVAATNTTTTTAAAATTTMAVPPTSPLASTAPGATPALPASVPPAPVAIADPTGSASVAAALIVAVNRQAVGRKAIPVTADNVSLLQRWIANEGGLWADNPLNTSHGAGGNPHQFTANGQDTGIPIFSSMSVGIEATAATLLSNPRYARILRALSRGTASCLAFANAVIKSPWASGHYGHDPSRFCSGLTAPRRGPGPRHHGRASDPRQVRR